MKLRNNDQIYLDYQATTPTESEVVDAMMPYFNEQFGNPHSNDHAMGWEASNAVDVAAAHIAKMIGAGDDEIIFTSGATESNNQAVLGIARGNKSAKRRKIFVGTTEHKCVLSAARAVAAESTIEVFRIPVNKEGQVDLDWLRERVDEQTLLVSIMAVNNEIGTISPIKRISKICQSQGAIFHCDAAQAPFAIKTNQLAEHADLISVSGHKMYGPKGVGVLYASRAIQNQVEPIIYGGGQQNNLRSGTVPVPLVVGMGRAAMIHDGWGADHREDLAKLRNELWLSIKEVCPKVVLNGPPLVHRHPGNLNVQFPGWDARDLLLRLQPNVAASTGAACTSRVEEPSHVLTEIGLTVEEANSSVRFSVGKFTNRHQIKAACQFIENTINSTV